MGGSDCPETILCLTFSLNISGLLIPLFFFLLPFCSYILLLDLLIPLWRLRCIVQQFCRPMNVFLLSAGFLLCDWIRDSEILWYFHLQWKTAKPSAHTQTSYMPVCLYTVCMYYSCHRFSSPPLPSPPFPSSLRYITVLLASSTPAYVQLGLKGKAELFCLWFVPAGVLSEHRAGTPLPSDRPVQAARRFMVYQNSGVIIVFGVRGKREPLEKSAIPLRSDSLITVLLAAAYRHTGAGGGGGDTYTETHTHRCLQYKSMHTPRETWVYTHRQRKRC